MERDELIDQPLPGSVLVLTPPPAPAIETIEPEAALAAVRDEVLAGFEVAGMRLARDEVPAFAALAAALARLAVLEWRVLAPRASESAHARLLAWCAAMPAAIAALADLAHEARGDELSRALLRRRTWQYGDAFRDSLAWRRAHCEAPVARLAAN